MEKMSQCIHDKIRNDFREFLKPFTEYLTPDEAIYHLSSELMQISLTFNPNEFSAFQSMLLGMHEGIDNFRYLFKADEEEIPHEV
jgi:hypothetical protein